MASEDSGSTRSRSFLLIVRTGRIFTAWKIQTGSAGYTGVPSI